jgi:WD40 repeat protein
MWLTCTRHGKSNHHAQHKPTDRDEDSFVFGASDVNIHLYQRANGNPVFCFLSITLAHVGAVESLEWDPHHHRLASVGDGKVHVWKVSQDQSMYYVLPFPSVLYIPHAESFVFLPSKVEKQPYVAQSVHFLDDGSSVLVSYLESGYMYILTLQSLATSLFPNAQFLLLSRSLGSEMEKED